MHAKRAVALFFLIILIFCFLIFKLFELSRPDGKLSQAALVQDSDAVTICTVRGTIYDQNLKPLVNSKPAYYALVSPSGDGPQQLAALAPYVSDLKTLEKRISQRKPFCIKVSSSAPSGKGIQIITSVDRYAETIAPQLIGYLNSEGDGVAGIEKAFDKELKNYSQKLTAYYPVDANGKGLAGLSAEIEQSGAGSTGGVELTIDRGIQQAAQKAADLYLSSGAVVVMDPKTGDILAMASNPTFSQNNLAAAVKRGDDAMTNKAFSSYNLGSVFKIVVTASALEKSISRAFSYTCRGSITIAGQTFDCDDAAGHGTEDMESGFKNSCNPYFINLGQTTGGSAILSMAESLGFGTSTTFSPGYASTSGKLPDAQTLNIPGELANFSIGQGVLQATPIQVARLVSTVVNGGLEPEPRLVKAIVDDGLQTQKAYPVGALERRFSESTAQTLQEFMIKTVEEGTGTPGKPTYGGAGAKTGTAQTGWVVDGKTMDQAWYAGFYPAESPKYVIVAMLKNGKAGGRDAGPVFKYIADYLAPSCGYPKVSQ